MKVTRIVAILILSLVGWLSGSDPYQQAVLAFQQGRFSEVIDQLGRLPLREADRPASQNLKALALCELRRYDDALAASLKACEADRSNMNYVYNLGLIQIAKKDFPAAERLFREALVRFPNSSKLHEGLGQSLFSLFQFPEAEKSFRRALEIEPLNASAQVAVCKLFYATGDKEKFAQAASRAVELDSNNYQACYYYGLWLSEYQSDQTAATKYFEKSIQLYPGFGPSLQALGKIRANQEDWERALELYERALLIDSQNRQLYFLASTAYRKLGKTERAEWALRQFKALESNANSSAKELRTP